MKPSEYLTKLFNVEDAISILVIANPLRLSLKFVVLDLFLHSLLLGRFFAQLVSELHFLKG